MSRPLVIALSAVALVVFVAISFGIARVLAAANTERAEAVDLVRAQGAGRFTTVVGSIAGCDASAACRIRVRRDVTRIARPGAFRLLRYDGPTKLALGGRTGVARVAWKVGTELPVVQCVTLRRSGNPISGFRVEVTRLSAPIDPEGDC